MAEELGKIPPRDCTHDRLVRVDPETGEEFWVSSGLDSWGRELPDPVPFAPPVAMGSHPSLADTILHIMRHAKLRELADQEGFDSEEEANDFDIEDEPLAPGTTLFEAWADLAARNLVETPPPSDPAAPPPAPAPEPAPQPKDSRPGGAGGDVGGSPGTPPTASPAPG